MLKTVAAGFAAFAVACTLATSRAQPASAPLGEPVVSAAKHRNDLLAQCSPAAPRSLEGEAVKFPIHVTNWGTVGPTVLIVHGGVQGGLGGNPATFAKQESLAKQGWRLQVVDRPGFGQSQSHGMDDMEADAVWIADMLGDGANLIGHSWGGAEALLAAARRPQAVRSLVLIEPAVQGLLADDPAVEKDPALKADAKRWAEVLTSAQTPAEYALALTKGLSGAETGDKTSNPARSRVVAVPAESRSRPRTRRWTSSTWTLARRSGSRDSHGSCGSIERPRPQSCRRGLGSPASEASPASVMRPLPARPGSSVPIIACATSVFPEPVSPMIDNGRPARARSETARTSDVEPTGS